MERRGSSQSNQAHSSNDWHPTPDENGNYLATGYVRQVRVRPTGVSRSVQFEEPTGNRRVTVVFGFPPNSRLQEAYFHEAKNLRAKITVGWHLNDQEEPIISDIVYDE